MYCLLCHGFVPRNHFVKWRFEGSERWYYTHWRCFEQMLDGRFAEEGTAVETDFGSSQSLLVNLKEKS